MRLTTYLFSFLISLCSACGTSLQETNEVVSKIIKDDLGREVRVPENAKRIISLTPSITELLYVFADTSKIVGRSTFCDYPESVKNKTAVNIYPVDIEGIVRLKADLILVKKGMISIQDIDKLEQLHQTVFVQEYDLLSDIETSTRRLVEITDGDSIKLAAWLHAIQIDSTQHIGKRKKYLAVVSATPIYVFGNSTFVSQLLDLSGGENCIQDVANPYPTVDIEYILRANPELYIFSSEAQKQLFFESYPILKKTLGFKNNLLFIIDDSILSRPGSRLPILRDSLVSIIRR